MAPSGFASPLDTPAEVVAWLRARGAKALCTDSRKVAPGDAFLAWPGHASDGRRHLEAAFAAGAVACVAERDGLDAFAGAGTGPVAAVAGLKALAGPIAAAWFGEPARAMTLLAVTGTNGKSSTAWWTAQALTALGTPCGVVGTLGIGRPPHGDAAPALESTGLTTPDAVTFHAALARLREQGVRACALEASSIGLAEQRLAGAPIRIAQFTNFTQDHLDHHGDMATYWQAKRALFDLPSLRAASVDVDDAQGARLAEALRSTRAAPPARRGADGTLELWTTSVGESAARPVRLALADVVHADAGMRGVLVERDVDADGRPQPEARARAPFATRLIGAFNLHNLLQVVAALRALGHPLPRIAEALAELGPVPGRMQRVDAGDAADAPAVVVDYAHTPDALEQALAALRPWAAARGGRLVVVFGCGGNRDATKRPRMGAIAEALADDVVITSDNPRHEDAHAIVEQVARGLSRDGAARRVVDRAEAIAGAIARAGVRDVVLVAGKGHETDQEVAGRKLPFSDVEHARAALAARRGGAARAEAVATPGPTLGKATESTAQAVARVAAATRGARGASAVGRTLRTPTTPVRVIRDPAQFGAKRDAGADDGRAMATLGALHEILAERRPVVRLIGADAERARAVVVRRVHTDTRTLQPGDLFVALRGDRFDGHRFLAQAGAAGAVAAVAERGLAAVALPGLAADDALDALQQLAAGWRARFALPLVAVAGSNGKTTVTQMVASILRAWHGDAALATAGNFNNHIGVPLTLLRLRPAHRSAVVELGMNHPGEIAVLAALAQPTVALVNNAQREHQEFMASVEAVADENGQALAALPADGVAVFPADDAHAARWQALAGARRVLRFADRGAEVLDEADAPAADAEVLGAGRWDGDAWALVARTPAGLLRTRVAAPGRHNLRNALAATACALAAGAPRVAVVEGLAAFRPVAGRSQAERLVLDGVEATLVDDAYNANPDSVRAAIDLLATLPAPRWLVFGDMGEVGAQGPAFHAEVGAYARERGLDALWAVGTACADAARAWGPSARVFDDAAAAAAAVAQGEALPTARAVLVKGSNFMKMGRVALALRERAARATASPSDVEGSAGAA